LDNRWRNEKEHKRMDTHTLQMLIGVVVLLGAIGLVLSRFR
jgi:hypothetical protein